MKTVLFVTGHFWEKSRGEWSITDYHFSLEEVAQFLNEKNYIFPQSAGEKIWFDIPRYIKRNEYGNAQFHEEIIYEDDLKNWYIHHKKTDDNLLNGGIIWLILQVPYSKTECSYVDIPLPFSQFCGLMWKQYHDPELIIEDIPF